MRFAAIATLLIASACSRAPAPSSSAPPAAGMLASPAADGSSCLPTALSHAPAPGPAPAGMVWIPGGEFSMGSNNPAFPDARPWHRVRLSGFWLSKKLVTNAEFARFVAATGYVTTAEQKPRAEDFPGVDPKYLVPGSLVFTPPKHPVDLNDDSQWWTYVHGANWRHPEGPRSSIAGRDTDPVVQVGFDDARAYARWAHARLPTEAEFEFAERGGLSCKPFAWGDAFAPHGVAMANTFRGHFPDASERHPGPTPVGTFAANGFGLYDMSGNVWEWTSDWYRADYYATLAAAGPVAVDPHGPPDSDDPKEPGVKKRSVRGGSFLCTDQFCSRYEVGGRGQAEPSSSAGHTGFRLAN
jgi:formylglycine-generating enzyme